MIQARTRTRHRGVSGISLRPRCLHSDAGSPRRLSQALHTDLADTGVAVHVVCPGIVATEFHEVQGMDLSAIPRMSDVVVAALTGIELGEVVSAPGVMDRDRSRLCSAADLAAFSAQSTQHATRYRPA